MLGEMVQKTDKTDKTTQQCEYFLRRTTRVVLYDVNEVKMKRKRAIYVYVGSTTTVC